MSGKAIISITKGTIECDFTLSNIPRIKDYVIRINSGMNILNFEGINPNSLIYYNESTTDTLSTGESKAYYFKDNTGKGKFLPRTLRIRYVGMYPVVKDTLDNNYSIQDWKGNVAFNGYSLRLDGNQSCWYPVIYDIQKDVAYSKVKYDIEIDCADCNTIYLNGNKPVNNTTAKFKSDAPRELSMYPGKYKTVNEAGTYFLNPDINQTQLQQFSQLTNGFKEFYSSKLGIPYKDTIVYVQTTPTSKNNAWLFVSYPTIFNIGYGKYGLKGLFDKETADWFKPFIAHELGHYYFGTYKVFNSELGDMMSEAFSEYLSLQAAQQLIADSIYNNKIAEKIKALKDFSAIPFAKVKSGEDYQNRELYVYYYAPVILTAIKKEIGADAMWLWLKTILQTPAEYTNYQFLQQTLNAALQNADKEKMIEDKYFKSNESLANAIEEIEKK